MNLLKELPLPIRRQSVSSDEIVLPKDAALKALDYFADRDFEIYGWEGWLKWTATGRIGHGNAPT